MVTQDNAMEPMPQHYSVQEIRTEPGANLRGGLGTRRRGLGSDGREILTRTVKRDVIPRLIAMPWMQAALARPSAKAEPLRSIIAEDVEQLVALCLEPDGQVVAAMVAELARTGVSTESLYIDLLTPVARRLGEMWESDECTFADVTIALLRLQNAQRLLAPAFVATPSAAVGKPRVLLLPVPGEQHTFGLSMVMDFFTRAGWNTWLGTFATEALAIDLIKRETAEMVGLSFACDDRIETAAKLIETFRRVSPNPNLIVMVGGPSFVADPALAERIGADATALDGHQAVLLAHDLLNAKAEHAK